MQHLRYLLPYLGRYRHLLISGFICALIGASVSTLGPYLLRLAVDDIMAQGIVASTLLMYGGLIVLVAVVDGLFKFGQRMLLAGTSYRIEFDLRQDLFDRYLRLDQSFYSVNYTGDLMARATNDLSAVRQLLGPGINGSATAVLTLLVSAVLMLTIDVPLALVVLLLLPFSTLIFVLVGNRMRAVFTGVQNQFGAISTRAQENFSGIRTIKAYAQEEAELAVFARDNDHYRSLNLRYVLLSGALWPSMALMLGIVSALVLLVGGARVASGAITLGELVQFNAYLGLLSFPMIMMGWMVSLYQQAAASMGRLLEVLRREPVITTMNNLPATAVPTGALEFRGVGIRFQENKETRRQADKEASVHSVSQSPGLPVSPSRRGEWMLHDISFSVPSGSSLAIVGATGTGKTTLVNLLGRVRDPDAGEVLIDGVDVRRYPLDTLRRTIGYVPQETFLFSVPLRENVAFGLGDSADLGDSGVNERLDHAVQVSQLVNDLGQFPAGLDTMVGERGVTLSGGQKQRVAIARAVLRDPAILVLDDAMSSVDTHTAARILSGLREVMRKRTSIIIAQRIATVKDADQIILINEGQIVERGTHQRLLALGGRYAAMYRRELLEAELSS